LNSAGSITHPLPMTLFKNIVLSAFLAFGFVGSIQAQADGELKIQSGQKVAFMGDSITQFGWDRPGGYVHLVGEALESVGVKIVTIPAGISGNTSKDMLGRVDKQVIEKKPDWMTLSCGVNDVWHNPGGVDLETYKVNMTAIVDKAQAAGIKVMLLTATMINENDNPLNQKLVAYNDFLKQLAKDKNLPLADLNSACWKVLKTNTEPSTNNFLTVDGVHMNPDGNMLMARGVVEAFGMAPAKVDAFEKAWRQSPTAAAVTAQMTLNAVAPVSLTTYKALAAAAKEQKIGANALQVNLLFEALRTVVKAHEQDATFTPAQAQGEIQAAFRQKVEAASATSEKH